MRSIKLPSWIERLLGVDPVAPPPHVFALERGALAYGRFVRGAGGTVFDAYRDHALPDGTFQPGPLGGPLRDPAAFRQLLGGFVEGLPGSVEDASLVLPDAWMRLTFTEVSELPRRPELRTEVLRWKLKRLVPFRVEELRASAVEVSPFPDQEEPLRLLLGFAIELLMAQLEEAFAAAGVRLGCITNRTLALAAAVERAVESRELCALVSVEPEAFSASYLRAGEPLLHRHKELPETIGSEARARTVRRELRLLANFVAERFPTTPVAGVFLAAPGELESEWLPWLRDELRAEPQALAFELFPLTRREVDADWLRAAPLYGAAAIEVA